MRTYARAWKAGKEMPERAQRDKGNFPALLLPQEEENVEETLKNLRFSVRKWVRYTCASMHRCHRRRVSFLPLACRRVGGNLMICWNVSTARSLQDSSTILHYTEENGTARSATHERFQESWRIIGMQIAMQSCVWNCMLRFLAKNRNIL